MARIPPHAHRQRRGPTQLFQQHFQEHGGRTEGALLAAEGVTRVHNGLDGIHNETHDHQNRPQRSPDAPSGRFLCPQTVTARRAGSLRGCYLGRSASGEMVEALRRLDGIRKDTRGRSERSTRPDPRGPWTHHLHPRGRCGGWGGHGWGAVGRLAGGSSGFRAPRAKM